MLQAGQRAGLDHGFALQLLQQAAQLGLQVSLNMCEEVLLSCIKHQDFPSASLTWLYAKAHCLYPSSCRSGSSSSGESAGQQSDAAAGRESWASKTLVHLYARGMARWLQEGGVSDSHKKRLQVELQALAQELTLRGVRVPQVVQQALQEAAAAASASSTGGEVEGAAVLDQEAADGGKTPSSA